MYEYQCIIWSAVFILDGEMKVVTDAEARINNYYNIMFMGTRSRIYMRMRMRMRDNPRWAMGIQ